MKKVVMKLSLSLKVGDNDVETYRIEKFVGEAETAKSLFKSVAEWFEEILKK